MAVVRPFVGTRYNPQIVTDLKAVVAPPYDVISPTMQDELYAASPHNVVRLILGKEKMNDDEYNNKYLRAASCLQSWRTDTVLIDEKKKSFYFYEQEFRIPGGEKKRRMGFFAAVRIEDYKSGKIRAHEQTFAGPKADRLKLLRSTQCNLSPIFCLYSDPEKKAEAIAKKAMAKKPITDITDKDGVRHRMWIANDKPSIKGIAEAMCNRELYIADGHHRYETAVNYKLERCIASGTKDGKQPYDYVMMFLCNAEQEGLTILPTHRILSKDLDDCVDHDEVLEDFQEHFNVTPQKISMSNLDKSADTLLKAVSKAGKKGVSFGMVLPDGRAFVIQMKPKVDLAELIDEEIHPAVRGLDVTILHHYVISKVWMGNPEIELDDDDILYSKDIAEALDVLKRRKACAVFLMNPTRMEQLREVAGAGQRMPHKSTYFYPKLLSGLVFRDLNAPW
ncbi:MAG: DUF1015 domain-containing protein [bacterium]